MGRNRRYAYDSLPMLAPPPRKDLPEHEVNRIVILMTRLIQRLNPRDGVETVRLGRVYDDVHSGYILCSDVWWVIGLLERYGIK